MNENIKWGASNPVRFTHIVFYGEIHKLDNMIKANELRIGNYVNGGTVYLNQMVVGITPSEIITINGKHYDIEDDLIQPILLTPEILEKAGFVKDEDRWQPNHKGWTLLTLKGFDLIINPENGSISKFWDTDDNWYSWSYPNIEHVHQLQNLYFALTGEELEITLT